MALANCLGLLNKDTLDIDLHKDFQGFVADCLNALLDNDEGFRYNPSQCNNLCHAFIAKLSKYFANNGSFSNLCYTAKELRFTKNIKRINVSKLGHKGEKVMQRAWKEMYRVVKEAQMYLEDCSNAEKWGIKSVTSCFGGEAYALHIHDLVWSEICLDLNYSYLQADSEQGYTETASRKISDFHAEMSNFTRIHDEYNDIKRLVLACEKAADDESNKLRIAIFLSAKLQATTRGEPAVIGSRICPWLQIDSKDLNPRMSFIGKGNFGTVYEGSWLGVKVAVKEIPLVGGNMDNLAPQIAVHAKLRSPFVVQLIGVCITDANCYFVMELVSSSLEKILEDRSEGNMAPMSLPVKVDMMLQISRGMEYLHSLSIMHMDLKSCNVLIEPLALPEFSKHGYGRVKICDFGDASLRLSSFRHPRYTKGAGQWRAPEVFSYAQQDHNLEINAPKEYTYKADVYSFAMTCYEILTGKNPFGVVLSDKAIYRMVIRGKRPSLPPSCPSVLVDFIKKCWDTDPNRRPYFEEISNFMRYMKLLIMRITDSGDQVSLSAICRDFDKVQLVKCKCNEDEEADEIRALEGDFHGLFENRCFLQQSVKPLAPKIKVVLRLPKYIQEYSYKSLQNITNNFSEEVGGVSCLMWKGNLSDGTQVAVRNISRAEISMLCQMHHPNVVRLRGVLNAVSEEGYGVFDHMVMGSLATKLFLPTRSILNWNIRRKIGLGIARFLAHLHNDHIKRFVNVQVNATNVYLDDRFTPKLGGFKSILPMAKVNSQSWELVLLLEESRNVQEFGVILFELLTGRRWENMQYSLISIHDSIQGEGGYKFLGEQLLDRELKGEVDMGDAMRWVRIALWCFYTSHLRKPNMNKVVLAMKGPFDVSSLPVGKMNIVNCFGMKKSKMGTAWEVGKEFLVNLEALRDFESFGLLVLPDKYILYKFLEIAEATNQFTTGRIGRSSVWKSNLRGQIVAITMRKVKNIKDFTSGVIQICSFNNANIINLLGGCCEGEHMYLVYDYVHGSSLADFLGNNRVPKTWISRLQIAMDVAHALKYMHHYSIINYVHNYLKSSSIIITKPGCRARICNVGASYLAGEYDIHDTQVKKNDVYAFGVILLELLTGNVTKHNGQLQWFSSEEIANPIFSDDGRWNCASSSMAWMDPGLWMDPRLDDSFPVDCAERVARLAVSCVDFNPGKRPDMWYVVEKLFVCVQQSEQWHDKVFGDRLVNCW